MGQVSEIGAVLATKITREITTMSPVVVSGKILIGAEAPTVESTHQRHHRLRTPWRARSMLLELAARRTPGSISKLRRWCVSWIAQLVHLV